MEGLSDAGSIPASSTKAKPLQLLNIKQLQGFSYIIQFVILNCNPYFQHHIAVVSTRLQDEFAR